MAYVSKTWVDRDSQYPTRRIIVHPDLTEEQVTVRRDEGIITTQGDVFDSNTMNNLEARIAAGIGEKQDQLTAGSGITIDANNVISATGGGGGASDLDDLSDVDITSPTDGQVLKYNSTSRKWENDDESGGGAEIDDTTTSQSKVWSSSKTSTELSTKQGTLTAGTGIAIDSNNVISATGGGGGGSYTAGEKIRIDSQDVISADPQYNIIWNGDSLADVKSRHLVGGLPYGFSRTNTASGFDLQHKGFRIDGGYGSDDNKNIVYEPPVSFNDPTWRSGVSDFILELYWTDDPNAEPVIYTKEVLQLEVNGSVETLILNGIELSVILSSGTYGGLFIAVDDTDNANGDIWITGLNLTVKNSTGMLWTPHDLAIQEYVASVAAPLYVELNGTLTAGATTVTLSNSEIRTTSTVDIYTDVYGVNPTAVAVSNGSMTLTFEAQQSAINVKVRVT